MMSNDEFYESLSSLNFLQSALRKLEMKD